MENLNNVEVIGVSWFSREEYEKHASFSEDAGSGPFHYDNWLVNAEKNYEKLKASGVIVIKVEINAAEFVVWCHSKGKRINSEARSLYVMERAALSNYRSQN